MHGIRRPPVLLLTLLVLMLFGTAAALPPRTEADRLFAFAGELMEQGDYYRAVTEYKRFLSYFPEDARGPLCRLNIALAYKRGARTDAAVEHFGEILETEPGSAAAEQAAYEIGSAYFEAGRYEEASRALQDFLEAYPASGRLDAARILLGWCRVHLWELDQAAESFAAVRPESPLHEAAMTLSQTLRASPAVPRKSPVLAGVLSAVLPGSGQAYTGRFREGLTSFVLNGSFLWAVAELLAHGNEAAGILLGFFETGWYSGGIFGAVNDAHKYNRRARTIFIRDLENRFPRPAEH